MVSDLKPECSFSCWYPTFKKDSLEATILNIPDDVLKYLEHDAFVMPIEAVKSLEKNSEWTDGSPITGEEEVIFFYLKNSCTHNDGILIRDNDLIYKIILIVVGNRLPTNISWIQ